MTFSNLKTRMIDLADDPAITPGQASAWLNSNYKTLLRERSWPFLIASGSFTVTSGTQEYTFSALSTAVTDYARMVKVWCGSTELQPVPYEERRRDGIVNSYYVTPDGLTIGLLPTPTNSTDTIYFDYEKTVADMSDDADEPCFLDDFHWILIWKALMNYQFQQREQSDEFRAQYEELLNKMISFYQGPAANAVPMFRSRYPRTYLASGTSHPLTT
jgi:hypothetical protein